MNTNRELDRLDDAIDRVARRLTSVDDDPALASRIVAALPERTTWFTWLVYSWAPRLALIVLVVAAGLLWNRREAATVLPPLQPVARVGAVVPFTPVIAAAGPASNRTQPLERLEPLEPLGPSDFERSLSAIEMADTLALAPLGPVSLPEDAPLTLEPLAIVDLPLSAESFSPRH